MAIQSLIIILLVLAGLLTLGVPISYAIGISSLAAIVRIMPFDVAVLTAAQRTFVGMSKFSLTAIPFFILAEFITARVAVLRTRSFISVKTKLVFWRLASWI